MKARFSSMVVGAVALAGSLAVGGTGISPLACAQLPSPAQSSSQSSSRSLSPEVTEVLREHDRYSVLVAALNRTSIDQGLAVSPSFTLLAPTDSAFAALDVPLSTLESEDVAEILRNHVIQRALTMRQLRSFSRVENVRGLSLTVGPDAATIAGTAVVEPNVKIENGIVHGVDRVITAQVRAGRAVSLR